MLVKRVRRKLPRNALEPLMEMCEQYSEKWNEPATKIFRDFLELMSKYADYFFSKPWPKRYEVDEATTFTDEDVDFLFEGRKKELFDRYMTICLKKNMSIEDGFMGCYGMLWTQDALDKRFLKPVYKSVLIAFEKSVQENRNAREILDKLKEQFSARLIHNSLVDLIEHGHPREGERKLIREIFELVHTVEGLEPCGNSMCDSYRNEQSKPNSSVETNKWFLLTILSLVGFRLLFVVRFITSELTNRRGGFCYSL
jgi:hypothetical protein